jgi:hypothetical protein
VNDVLKRAWEEAVVVKLKILFQNLHGVTKENHRTIQDMWPSEHFFFNMSSQI